MTLQEFIDTKWAGGMNCIYDGKERSIASVCFTEKLIAFSTEFDDDLQWVRCENVELIMDDFHKFTKYKASTFDHKISCVKGLWEVIAPTKEQAEREGRHYFNQYFADGEYK